MGRFMWTCIAPLRLIQKGDVKNVCVSVRLGTNRIPERYLMNWSTVPSPSVYVPHWTVFCPIWAPKYCVCAQSGPIVFCLCPIWASKLCFGSIWATKFCVCTQIKHKHNTWVTILATNTTLGYQIGHKKTLGKKY